MQCLILAGGLGTRMRPVTESVPKALIPVLGKPFAFHQLELLARNGITRVTYSIGFKGERITEAVGDGARFGLKVDYVQEGPELLGTGGAVRLAFDRGVLEPVFFLLYGDSYLPTDYRKPWEAFAKQGSPCLMTVFHNQGLFDQSNAKFEEGYLVYDKKAAAEGKQGFDFIDYGLSVIRRESLARIPAGEKTDLAAYLHGLSREKALCGFEVKERFYEAGSPQGLRDLEAFLGSPEGLSPR